MYIYIYVYIYTYIRVYTCFLLLSVVSGPFQYLHAFPDIFRGWSSQLLLICYVFLSVMRGLLDAFLGLPQDVPTLDHILHFADTCCKPAKPTQQSSNTYM